MSDELDNFVEHLEKRAVQYKEVEYFGQRKILIVGGEHNGEIVSKESILEFENYNPDPEPVEQFVAAPKTGRNEKCPCGSGKKFKQCCMDK